jgi:hypothetical protein
MAAETAPILCSATVSTANKIEAQVVSRQRGKRRLNYAFISSP